MRNLLLLLLLVLLIFLTRYCQSCCGLWGNCPTVNTNELCADPLYKDSIYCHQIITQGPQSSYFKAKLDSLGFIKTDSCDCDANFALWVSASHTVVDLISAPPQESAGGRVGGVGGDIFCVNIPMEFTPRIVIRDQTGRNDTTKLSNPGNATTQVVKIAVIDSGVDTTVMSIKDFLWRDKSPLNSGCGSYPQVSPYGINMADKTKAPIDMNNHGTQLNSILINYSKLFNEYYWQNEDYYNNVRLEIINVKFTEGSTLNGSLFKAICGMYYAIKKGAKVINVSWGFYADDVPVILKPILQYAQDSNVLIVAGAGNRKSNIDGQRSFWPAAFARDTMSYWDDATKKIKNVISVGGYKANPATHNFENVSDTSNYGANSVNIFALGQDVLTILAHPSGQTALGDGTSFATPFVTRTAAILRGIKPSKTAAEIKQCVINASKAQGTPIGNIKSHNHAATLFCN